MGLFDKFLDHFSSPQYARTSMKKNYLKVLSGNIKKGWDHDRAHFDSIARLLIARSVFSKYNVNRAKLMSELYPFSQNKPEICIDYFIEYILLIENEPEVNIKALTNFVKDEIYRILNKEATMNPADFKDHVEIMHRAIKLQIPWTNLMAMEDEGRITEIIENNEDLEHFKSSNRQHSLNSDEESIWDAVEPIIKIIEMQLQMFGRNRSNLPAKARDAFSLGYIIGMLDASLTLVGKKEFEEGIEATRIAFKEIFGSEQGDFLTNTAISHFTSENKEFENGLSAGGTEYLKYLRKKISAPLGWSQYIMSLDG